VTTSPTTTATKFTLPISPNYVSHWGLWEAVRELYQNALDAPKNARCYARIEHEQQPDGSGILYVTNAVEEPLAPSSLILGETTKADDPNSRGKFGEGYKLAMLVLCRLGYGVEMYNCGQKWTPRIEHDETFGAEVLNIYVEQTDETSRVLQFRVHGVPQQEWFDTISKNIHPIKDRSAILHENDQVGRIYVGGLFVCTMPDFKKGYCFAPGELPLDRDRGMVSDFDLSMLTSKLHAEEESDDALDLVEAEAPDVRYVTSHARVTTPLVLRQAAAFTAKHGADAIPVTTQAEVERAQAAGLRWVLVKNPVKALIGLVRSWFIPSVKTPVERLREFQKQYQWNMTREMAAELADIIRVMSPPEGAPECPSK
jgi:hypothetical protein